MCQFCEHHQRLLLAVRQQRLDKGNTASSAVKALAAHCKAEPTKWKCASCHDLFPANRISCCRSCRLDLKAYTCCHCRNDLYERTGRTSSLDVERCLSCINHSELVPPKFRCDQCNIYESQMAPCSSCRHHFICRICDLEFQLEKRIPNDPDYVAAWTCDKCLQERRCPDADEERASKRMLPKQAIAVAKRAPGLAGLVGQMHNWQNFQSSLKYAHMTAN